jgi:PAS domain S-box-containing protein
MATSGLSWEPDPRAATEERSRRLIENLADALLLEDERRRILIANQSFADMFSPRLGARALDVVDGLEITERIRHLFADPAEMAARTEAIVAGRVPVTAEPLLLADGRVLERDYIPVFVEQLYCGHVWRYTDVTARVRDRRRLAVVSAVSEALMASEHEADAHRRVLDSLCSTLGWQCATAYVASDDGLTLEPVASTSNGTAGMARHLPGTEMVDLVHGQGPARQAWRTGETQWVASIEQHASCEFGREAMELGLTTAMFVPVRGSHSVLGVLAFYGRLSQAQESDLVTLSETVASQLGQFIDRSRAETQVRASESRTRLVMEHMLEGLILVREGTCRITEVNSVTAKLFGYEAIEMVGMPVSALVPDSYLGPDGGLLPRMVTRAIGTTTEWLGKRRNGYVFPVELQLSLVDAPDGRLLAGFIRDLTDRDAVDVVKKQLVSTVSHELRTPLTSIRGSLSLLATGVLGELTPEATRIVNIAERNVIRLVALINDILDLERAGSGGMTMAMSNTLLKPVIDRAIESVGSTAQAQQISVLNHVGAEVCVLGDASRLVQVVVNLLSNAVKFSPGGAEVEVSAEVIGPVARVEVLDRGPGVAREYRDVIFEPYRQAEATDSRQKGGTGLGLAICRAIVQQHEGHMGVDDREGGGSVFWFTVPARTAPQEATA